MTKTDETKRNEIVEIYRNLQYADLELNLPFRAEYGDIPHGVNQ